MAETTLPDPADRRNYHYFSEISTRWIDNDIYGHINNVVYYQFFDTVSNLFLIERCGLDIHNDPVIAYIVASSCQYLAPISHPASIHAGFRVNRLGNSSVEYGIAIFDGEHDQAAAWGTYTHVFVDRHLQRPAQIPEMIRQGLQSVLARPATV